MTVRPTFRQAELTRMFKAAAAAGMEVKIEPGVITVMPHKKGDRPDEHAPGTADEWDETLK